MRALRLERRQVVVLGLAACVWSAAVAGRWWQERGLWVLVPIVVLTAVPRCRRPAMLALVLAAVGWWSGHGSASREAAILSYPTREGRFEAPVRLLDDPLPGDYGWRVLAVPDPPEPERPPSVPMLVTFERAPDAVAGERLWVEGRRSRRTGRVGGDPYSGVVEVASSSPVPSRSPPWLAAGNQVRSRALERLHGRGAARALLAGFLVGDTTELSQIDLDAMRKSGLTHLVAVSGSNVSLFLTLTVLASGPLAAGPRRRALVGLAVLVVLVVATRWEPSVIRASFMAALMLAGRVGGWAPDPPSALSATVITVVAVSGEMATDVGFSMSVFATLGVLAGARLFQGGRLRPVATLAGATLGAQLAVAPIVLAVFGSIPLLAPLTNLVAVPVVSATTALAAVAVALGWEPLIDVASIGAEVVLVVARLGSGWPQIGWLGYLLALVGLLLAHFKSLRPALALGVAGAVAVPLAAPPARLPLPAAVILDVGQGDAILVVASDRSTMLVDTGPDPSLLDEKLAEYGVATLDLVVLTHVHADHISGLEAVVGRRQVGEVWLPTPPHSTPAAERAVGLVEAVGVPNRLPPVGQSIRLGDLTVEVLAPLRRYASPNDQSTVLAVSAPDGPRLLLTGDIETYAQADLQGLTAEILKVPHQGAATSDLSWLEKVGARFAVISVGDNDYGHPSLEVIEALQEAGARIARTDQVGDVVVPLGPHIDGTAPAIETPDDVPR